MAVDLSNLIWGTPFMSDGEKFNSFWSEYLKDSQRDLLYIFGLGFDPRATQGFERILSFGGTGKRDCRIIQYRRTESDTTSRHEERVKSHLEKIDLWSSAKSQVTKEELIILTSTDNRNVSDRNAAALFNSTIEFEPYSDVLIDISAMPRGIYIPLINKILTVLYKHQKFDLNVHIIISENSALDALISSDGKETEASPIHGLSVSNVSAKDNQKKVWMPILGENRSYQMERIFDFINPDEICPVVPFPAMNIRRGDDLIMSYQNLLFSQFDIQANNIIHADERNPFQTYRILMSAIHRYDRTFNLLHGCKIFISSLSSKLLSVGAILAAFESKLNGVNAGMVQVSSLGHKIDETQISEETLGKSELYHLWLFGEPYI